MRAADAATAAGGAAAPPARDVTAATLDPSEVDLDLGGRLARVQSELEVSAEVAHDLLSAADAEICVIASLSEDYCHIVTPPDVWGVELRTRIYLGHYHEFHYVSTRRRARRAL